MIQFQKNVLKDGGADGRKDGQTLFHRIVPASTEGSKKFREKDMRVILGSRLPDFL